MMIVGLWWVALMGRGTKNVENHWSKCFSSGFNSSHPKLFALWLHSAGTIAHTHQKPIKLIIQGWMI